MKNSVPPWWKPVTLGYFLAMVNWTWAWSTSFRSSYGWYLRLFIDILLVFFSLTIVAFLQIPADRLEESKYNLAKCWKAVFLVVLSHYCEFYQDSYRDSEMSLEISFCITYEQLFGFLYCNIVFWGPDLYLPEVTIGRSSRLWFCWFVTTVIIFMVGVLPNQNQSSTRNYGVRWD